MSRINPVDDLTEKLAQVFLNVQDKSGTLSEEELTKIKTTIAVGIISIKSSVDLVSHSFLPAARSEITKSKNQILKSKYKNILLDTYDKVEELHYEVIRLGYVLSFHKYEYLVKSILDLFDSFCTEDNKNGDLGNYMDKKLKFRPTQWYKAPETHIVSFISNCTKHSDGKCKLDKALYSKPLRYAEVSNQEYLTPSLKEYKNDIKRLLESFNILLTIISYSSLLRLMESQLEDDISSGYYTDVELETQKNAIKQFEATLTDLVDVYTYP